MDIILSTFAYSDVFVKVRVLQVSLVKIIIISQLWLPVFGARCAVSLLLESRSAAISSHQQKAPAHPLIIAKRISAAHFCPHAPAHISTAWRPS
jgi:hypothetical protein